MANKIKFIPWSQPLLSKKDKTIMNIAFDSSWVSGGPFVTKFQKLLKKITKRKYAYATSSGTTAIHLAYLSINLKPNDEIIVPSFTISAPTFFRLQHERDDHSMAILR